MINNYYEDGDHRNSYTKSTNYSKGENQDTDMTFTEDEIYGDTNNYSKNNSSNSTISKGNENSYENNMTFNEDEVYGDDDYNENTNYSKGGNQDADMTFTEDEVYGDTNNYSKNNSSNSNISKGSGDNSEDGMTFTENEIYGDNDYNENTNYSNGGNQDADMTFTEDEVYGDTNSYSKNSSNNAPISKGDGDNSEDEMTFTEEEIYGSNNTDNEWNKRRSPREGETLMGHPIRIRVVRRANRRPRRFAEVELDGRVYKIIKYGSQPYGIKYGGQANLTREKVNDFARRYTNSDPFMEKAVKSYNVLGEGGFSSINTWDNKVFTLGTGLAGRRLNRFLESLRDTELGNRISRISYFNNLRFNADRSRSIRLDINAIHQIVLLFESEQFMGLVCQESINDYLNNSLKISQASSRQREWIVQNNVKPEILGLAAYLKHGRPRYTPSPIRDVLIAERQAGSSLSKKAAYIIKLHAQRIFLDTRSSERVGGGPDGKQASAAAMRRLPKKPGHFQRALRDSGQRFTFNYDEARQIIPCIRPFTNGRVSWATSSRRPSGVYLKHEEHYFNLGPRIR